MARTFGENDEVTVSFDSITERTRRVPPGADAARAVALKGLQALRTAQATGQERELARLRGKLGDRHPRVTDLERRIVTDKLVVRHLGAEAERAETPAVVAPSGTWILHGRVRGRTLSGQAQHVVTLSRAEERNDRGARSEPTDHTGYFRITMTGVEADAVTEDATVGPELTVGGRGPVESKGPRHAEKRLTVSARVLDANDDVVHEDPRPLVPRSGHADYIEMILVPERDDESGGPRGPDRGGIRRNPDV